MSGPIKPSEVINAKTEQIPQEVFDCFNQLIVEKWNGYSSVIKEAEVVKLIERTKNVSSNVVFTKHWLDVEDSYRKAGWNVVYDKPAYCGSYEPTFTFSKKKTRG